MKFVNPLPFVSDIAASKAFYADVIGLRIVEDHGDVVMFEGGFAIHEGSALFRTVFGADDTNALPYGRGNLVLYFEEADLEGAYARVCGRVDLIHGVRQEPWGQRLFRFYDPDRHIVEVGEPQ